MHILKRYIKQKYNYYSKGERFMRIERFHSAPQQAIDVRITVFVNEQGFRDEFDDIDAIATHFVALDDAELPIATCRVFMGEDESVYLLGRLAVVKEYRGQDVGSRMVACAEEYVREAGGKELRLHAQCRVAEFYEKNGYTSYGEIEEEEGCPHIWMKKSL